MKTLIALLLLSTCWLQVNAQEIVQLKGRTVHGTITDDKKITLPYVVVTLKDSLQKNIAVSITDEKGSFQFDVLPAGTIHVNFTLMGFKPHVVTLTATALGTNNLGSISLQQDVNQLKEVVVSAGPTVSYSLDKKVFQAGRDIIAQNGSAVDLLAGVPSVSVSPAGAVSLRGNANVLVLINGRRSGTVQGNALDQLPADQIERVEVITNPSSRYDAAGSAGIINIILKKNKRSGFNGQLKLVGGIPNETRINPSLNYKSDKINLFSTFGLRLSDYVGLYHTNRQLVENGNTSQMLQLQDEQRHDDARMLYLGADITLGERSTITTAFLKNATNDHDRTQLYSNYYTVGAGADSSLTRNGESHEKRSYNQLEFNYTQHFEQERKKFTVDMQYDFWDSDKDWYLATQRNFPNAMPQNAIRTSSIGKSKDLSVQSDLVLPLDSVTTLEFGIKMENRTVTSNFLAEQHRNNQWQVLENIDNRLAYEEMIAGAYAQLGGKISKLGYQAGLRTELTRIDISDRAGSYRDKKNYTRLFPTLNLSYPLSKSATLQASYSRRINRPSLNMIYPFTELTDLTSRYVGNPNLNPSFAHVVELGYLQRINRLTVNPSAYYQYNTGLILDYIYKNANNIFIATPINIEKEVRSGIELSMLYDPAQWLQLSMEANLYNFSQSGVYAGQNFDYKGNAFNAKLGSQLKFPKIAAIQVRYSFFGAQQNAQTKEKAIHNIDMGISRNFFNNRASLVFDGTNLFSLRKYLTTTTGSNYYIAQGGMSNAARYRLTFVYRLNLKDNQAIRQAKTGNRN